MFQKCGFGLPGHGHKRSQIETHIALFIPDPEQPAVRERDQCENWPEGWWEGVRGLSDTSNYLVAPKPRRRFTFNRHERIATTTRQRALTINATMQSIA